MKNLLFLLCLLFLISCKSTHKKYTKIKKYVPLEKEVERELMNEYGYTLNIPNNWHCFLNVHRMPVYCPNKFIPHPKKSTPISIRISPDKTRKSLDVYVKERILNRKKYISNFKFEKDIVENSKLGRVIVLKYGVNTIGVEETYHIIFLKSIDKIYEFNFSGQNSFYKEYVNEAEKIINSFKVIEETKTYKTSIYQVKYPENWKRNDLEKGKFVKINKYFDLFKHNDVVFHIRENVYKEAKTLKEVARLVLEKGLSKNLTINAKDGYLEYTKAQNFKKSKIEKLVRCYQNNSNFYTIILSVKNREFNSTDEFQIKNFFKSLKFFN